MKHMLRTLILIPALAATAAFAETPLTYDRVSLSAAAAMEVENDTMTASLYAQEEGADTPALANKVNEAIAWAVAEAKSVAGVKIGTEGYTTAPVYNRDTITGWRVRQQLSLSSTDMTALSALLGRLQRRVKLSGIGFSVSPARAREVEEQLTREALDAFTARATLIANQLKHEKYQLVDISVSGQAPRMMSKARGMMADMAFSEGVMAAAPPVAEAGEETISVNVNGSIELR